MEQKLYRCDCCGKEFKINSKGKLLYPEYIISADGDSFIYCSKECMIKGENNIVTSKEVENILHSLNLNRINYRNVLLN